MFFLVKQTRKQPLHRTKIFLRIINQEVVHDLSNLFSIIEAEILSQKIIEYEKTSTNEIAILTVNSISPYSNIQTYGTDVSNLWGIGKKEKNNGLLITLCKPSRNVAICTGYGTEKIITAAICQKLIDNTLIPNFKKNEYFQGLNAVIDSIITKW